MKRSSPIIAELLHFLKLYGRINQGRQNKQTERIKSDLKLQYMSNADNDKELIKSIEVCAY